MTLDFYISPNLSPDRILFQDISDYGGSVPSSVRLDVKFPDFSKIYSTPVQFSSLNKINTVMLGYTDCITEFTDGIYEFEFHTKNCSLKRKEYIITQALKMLDEKLRNVDISNKEILEKYCKIQLFLHGAKVYAECASSQADAHYKQALSLIKCL